MIIDVKKKVLVFMCLLLAAIPMVAYSQETVNGTVYESDGVTPMIGATILLKGTSMGVSSDLDGNYAIKISGTAPVLVFQAVGCEKQEVAVDGRTTINVVMKSTAKELDEVVVTALGLTREQKSLGYAVTKVDNAALNQTVSGNWLNGMSGKVAGLDLAQAGTGPMSSMRVTLRGDQSLNYSANEALFVVDGIPISSGTTAIGSGSNYANENGPIDFGNDASDINPEDVESVTVLKGPSATALYGSRAANGAIIITTKSGRKDKGIGVTINSSVTFERAGYFPDFQTEYGSGSDMGLNPFSFWALSADEASDGIATTRHISRYAFGEKFDANVYRYQYNSKNWETGTYTRTPWVYQDDWYTGLFETGVTYNNTVTIDGSNGKGTNTRLSITDTRNDWILPNTGYEKQTVALSFNTEMNKWLKLNAKVNYFHKESDNLPASGYDETAAMYILAWGYNTNSINEYKNEYFNGRFNGTNYSGNGTNGESLVNPSGYNPYRTLYEELNTLEKNRVFGNIGLTATFMKGLTLDVRAGIDLNDEFRTQQKPYYVAGYPKGMYREQTLRRLESNVDFLLRYINNDLFDHRLNYTVAFGGNNMHYNYSNQYIYLDELNVEGVYNVNNSPSTAIPIPYNRRTEKTVNSLYGFVSASWDDTYFLDLTGRNDWSSTLAPSNWSYFYPSVSASVLLDNAFKLHDKASWIDMLKLRVSWANVGNDTNPYSLNGSYSNSSYSGGYTLPGTLTNYYIEPENVESWEAGIESRFFMNRIGLDVAVYNSSTTNQIVSAKTDPTCGATSMKINAGEIRNRGIEITAHFVPIQTRDFEWTLDVNWAKNWNKLVSLQEGWNPDEPLQTAMGTTIGSRVYIYSYVGKEMNVIYGKGYQRAPEGSYYMDENGNKVDCSGMKLVDASTGYPILDEQPNREIGKVNPDWTGGLTTTFRYKNVSLGATFSAQWGGNCYSVTNFCLGYQGKLANSLEGRYDGLVVAGVNAIKNADGTISYQKNSTVTSNTETYYNAYVWTRDNVEENTFDTSYLKLKELRVDYSFPKSLLAKTKVLKYASVGAYATNLFCITNFPQYDPETGLLNGSDVHKGIETMTFPMTRTYGFNVKLQF